VGLRIAYLPKENLSALVKDRCSDTTHLNLKKVLWWAVDLLEAL
jgi:hypothetical protein